MMGIATNGSLFYATGVPPEAVGALRESYRHASPFPHIVIDDFLPQQFIDKIIAHFPEKHLATVNNKSANQYLKKGYRPQNLPDNPCNHYLSVLNSAPVLQFLECLTGIDGLMPDPYYHGGGLHETDFGGRLEVHTDFTLHPKLNLLRRTNMIIFLNKDWQPSYGGDLELWNASLTEKVVSVSPVYNRCVIFNTTETSFHGQPEPLQCPIDRSRRSIALYYYTAITDETKHTTDTNWRKKRGTVVEKIVKRLFGTLQH